MILEVFNNKLKELRQKGRVLTNSTLTRPILEVILSDIHTQVFSEDDFLVLLTEEDALRRIYLFALEEGDWSHLDSCLSLNKSEKPIVADIVARGESAQKLIEKMKMCGFYHYDRFVRMTCADPTITGTNHNIPVETAKCTDAVEIRKLLFDTFDFLSAHIPTIDELTTSIQKGEIDIIRDSGKIAGLTFFEPLAPHLTCLRYFLVAPEFQKKGMGKTLLKKEFDTKKTSMNYHLWISVHNSTTLLYQKIGFVLDGLNDDIMIYGKRHNG